MKGLLAGILALPLFIQTVFSGTAITANSFVRHDVPVPWPLLDFTVGKWNKNGDAMVVAVTTTNLEIAAIGKNAQPISTNLIYAAPGVTGPISVGDINGDGADDIVYGAGTNLVVRFNTSSTTAPGFDTSTKLLVGSSGVALGLAVTDLDGDGKLDIVYATSAIYALRNQSTAGSVSFAAPITIYTNAARFEIGDLDGDGRPDLEVRPAALTPRPLFLRNASFPKAINFVRTSSTTTLSGFLVDINGDAKPDHVSVSSLAFPTRNEPSVSLEITTNSSTVGAISFARTIPVAIDALPPRIASKLGATPDFRPNYSSGDFNHDGRLDLVWMVNTNSVVFLENLNGAPPYVTTWGAGVEFVAPMYPFEPMVADMNGDGKLDVVVGGGFGGVSIFENRIQPVPELALILPQAVVGLGEMVELRADAYGADVSAVDFFEDGRFVASAAAAPTIGFRAEYEPTKAGLHTITARATGGASAGLESQAAGLRVRDLNVGRVVAFGSGVASSTTLLIYESGRAFGVGSNSSGQLADPFYDAPHRGFVEIRAPTNAGGWKDMSAGSAFTIGLTTSGRVFSWGANDVGQLGRTSNTSTDEVPAEVTFKGGATIRKIAAGSDFAMALDENGELFGWGNNSYGQLGNGFTGVRTVPRKVKKPDGVNRWSDVSVGLSHALALDDEGKLFGWGWNLWGQAGQARTNVAIVEPTLIELPAGETAWTNICAGVSASYAQTASGRTYRWGNYLTDAGPVYDEVPRLLEAPEGSGGFRMFGLGAPLNAALGNDGNAYVWGGGVLSPSGLGGDDFLAVTNPTRLPLPAGVAHWTNLAVALRRAAALADDGRVFAWGYDFGNALGTGTVAASVPTEICLPLADCASNSAPAVKIVRPVVGDLWPVDGMLRFEIAADDFDGVVQMVRIVQQSTKLVPGPLLTVTTTETEVARLGFGESRADIVAPAGTLFSTSYIPVVYDNNGLVSTGATLRLTFPNLSSGSILTLTNSVPINSLTGWREVFDSSYNNSSFRYGSVVAVISNIPPGVVIRTQGAPTLSGVERITNVFGTAPREFAGFRFEYKLPEEISGAQVNVRFFPGPPVVIGSATGETQPVMMTTLTNGFRVLEFDHAPGEQHIVQFTDTLTNWFDAGGFLEEGAGKMLWIDGGGPATPKHPAQAAKRFYRVLRTP